MGRVERDREIARRRVRRVKLKKLREKYAASKDPDTRAQIAEKVRRISPFASLDVAAE
ncbi:MAG: hypothetical protein O2955_10250 [Planctomycetota bacterium]|nr:hypothetical protein [Planctomycetota bacterium]MDA1212891.1 hypothetical protein [Planctomycetota bacterium]